MGIVNVTPDSFSDGGKFLGTAAAIAHGQKLIAEGADMLDIGGESSRPGAAIVTEAEEMARVLPVIETLATSNIPISIDTVKPEVMRRALASGASIVNDINALGNIAAREVVAASSAGVVLMHMQGVPQTMQLDPQYVDVVEEVMQFLTLRAQRAMDAGIEATRIALDPGFGFGKLRSHNLLLLQKLNQLTALGYPILIGISRKSMLKGAKEQAPAERLPGSLAGAIIAVLRGARIVRVHDVAETRQALDLLAEVTEHT